MLDKEECKSKVINTRPSKRDNDEQVQKGQRGRCMSKEKIRHVHKGGEKT